MADDLRLHLDPEQPLLAQLVDHIIVFSFEIQTAFADRYAGLNWRADLKEPATFWFEREPVAVFRPHFLGTSSGNSYTWLWGWENINGFPDAVVETARAVHAWGKQLGCAELLTAEQPLEEEPRRDLGLTSVGAPDQALVFAAATLSGLALPTYYRAPTGGDSYAWFLLDNAEEFVLPSASTVTTASAISQAVASGYLSNARTALRGYGDRRDGVEISDDGDAMLVSANDGELRIEFDALGRVSHIAGTAE